MAESKDALSHRYQKTLSWDIDRIRERTRGPLTSSGTDMNDLHTAFAFGPSSGLTRDGLAAAITKMVFYGDESRRTKLVKEIDTALADLLKKGYIK